jgi:glycine/D-amino acid oxidase-like deaminating enzyme
MKIPQGSPWKNVDKPKEYPKLETGTSADVAIIGGGLAGIDTAYMLSKEGLKVVLLEKEKIGSGATEYTTAMITQFIDTGLTDLKKIYGMEKAGHIMNAKRQSLETIAQIVEDEKLDCEFMRCPNFSFAADERQTEDLEEEYKTSKEFGIEGSFNKDKDLGFKHFGVWEVANQAQYHPLKFLYSLAKKAEERGAEIYEHSEVDDIEEEEGIVNVKTKIGSIVKAKYAITCTYVPIHNPIQTLFKKGMYVTYAYEVSLPKGSLQPGLYEDLHNPYNYFRIDQGPDSDRMLIGGEDHRKELKIDPEKSFSQLRTYLENLLPNKKIKIVRRWTGPILEPSDGLALIGEYRPNLMVATAFSGNGMTYSMLSAMIFKDIIKQQSNPWIELFDPKRIPSIYQLYVKGKDYMGIMGDSVKKIME